MTTIYSKAGTDAAISGAVAELASHTHASTSITDWAEAVQDTVAAMLTSGSNVTLFYNDAAGTLSVTAAGGDAEVMRDTIGAALVGINGVTVAINDALDTITLSVTGLTIAQVTGLQGALDGKAPALGADDNYVTDAEKAALHTHPAVVAAGADAAAARAAIGAGTSSLVIGTGAGDAKAGNYAPDLSGLAPASGQFATFALTADASVTLSASYPAQSLTMTSATTLIAPTVTDGHAIVLWLSGAFVPTWWAGIKWAGGIPPSYASTGTLYHLLKIGASWFASGQAYS